MFFGHARPFRFPSVPLQPLGHLSAPVESIAYRAAGTRSTADCDVSSSLTIRSKQAHLRQAGLLGRWSLATQTVVAVEHRLLSHRCGGRGRISQRSRPVCRQWFGACRVTGIQGVTSGQSRYLVGADRPLTGRSPSTTCACSARTRTFRGYTAGQYRDRVKVNYQSRPTRARRRRAAS